MKTTEAPDSDDPEDPTRQERLRELAKDMRRQPAESERIQLSPKVSLLLGVIARFISQSSIRFFSGDVVWSRGPFMRAKQGWTHGRAVS